ncbi:MAG TPA: DUF6455 family protein [Azospirillum sp.]|nr:DUF6455 family protein [Azospirillum sp.]
MIFSTRTQPLWGRLARVFRDPSSAELSALEAFDRSRVLADVAVLDSQLPGVMKAKHSAELLPAALERYGVDVQALDHDRRDILHDLQRVCAVCRSTRVCRQLLASGAAAEEHARICLNADTLEALR